MTKVILPTPEQINQVTQNVKVQGIAKQVAEEMFEAEKGADSFNEFITFTKEKFDKHFAHLGYTCFVFDKDNPKNKFMSLITNCQPNFYLGKLIPFIKKHRQTLKNIKKKLDTKLSKVN